MPKNHQFKTNRFFLDGAPIGTVFVFNDERHYWAKNMNGHWFCPEWQDNDSDYRSGNLSGDEWEEEDGWIINNITYGKIDTPKQAVMPKLTGQFTEEALAELVKDTNRRIDEAHAKGYEEGKSSGYAEGYNAGYDDGYNRGYDDGRD